MRVKKTFVNLFVEFALCTGGRLETILHIQKRY